MSETPQRILFVCTGNICRSVMAEYLLKKKIKDEGLQGLETASQGVAGSPVMKVPDMVVRLMQEIGIDVTAHTSSFLSAEKVGWADLILVMEARHKEIIALRHPDAKDKTFLLHEYAQNENRSEVPDPIGQKEDAYRECLASLQKAVDNLVKRLKG